MKPPCTERYARWCERTGVNHSLLLDQYGAGAAACGWFLDAPHDIVEHLHPDALVLFPHGRVL